MNDVNDHEDYRDNRDQDYHEQKVYVYLLGEFSRMYDELSVLTHYPAPKVRGWELRKNFLVSHRENLNQLLVGIPNYRDSYLDKLILRVDEILKQTGV